MTSSQLTASKSFMPASEKISIIKRKKIAMIVKYIFYFLFKFFSHLSMRAPCRCECSDESDLITVFCLTHFLCRETGSSRSPGPGAGSTQLDTRTGPHFLPTDGTRDPGDERVAADLFRELMDAGRHNHVILSFTLISKAIRHSSLKYFCH